MITFGRRISARAGQTLLLAGRQHMRVVADVVRQQTDHAQGFDYLLLPRLGSRSVFRRSGKSRICEMRWRGFSEVDGS
jgi:hypothetical protein